MAGRQLRLDPRRTTVRQGVERTTSWAAIVAAFFGVAGFATAIVAVLIFDYMSPELGVLIGAELGLGLIFAVLALGDR